MMFTSQIGAVISTGFIFSVRDNVGKKFLVGLIIGDVWVKGPTEA